MIDEKNLTFSSSWFFNRSKSFPEVRYRITTTTEKLIRRIFLALASPGKVGPG
jgi:hypothetical protein